MKSQLTVLILTKRFWLYPKHQPKIDMIKALEKHCEVYYWYHDGHIDTILKSLNIKPDFIFHYDIAWNYGLAPKIDGLGDTDILKGCYVIDLHWKPDMRRKYFKENKIDLIFSATKHPFLKVFPEYKSKFRWLPWSINPSIMKDWKMKKDIDSLLMGLVYVDKENVGKHTLPIKTPPKGRYAFRDMVFEKMKDEAGFVFHPHPGHRTVKSELLIVNEDYAKELNRAKIFYTCGSRNSTGGIAVLKFFEALACRTLLLAEPNKDIEDLGFIDGENFIACTVDDLVEKTNFYLNHPQECERITNNGYLLAHQKHTNDHRAKGFLKEVKEILS